MAKENTGTTTDYTVTAREIDFVTQFERDWQHLRDVLGIVKPIKKAPGTVLKSKYAAGTLKAGTVGEGEEIPYSKFEVKTKDYAAITVEKYAKAVSLESIAEHGYDVAMQMTDDEFRYELTQNVVDRFYTYLNTGKLTSTETTFQKALSMAKGNVLAKFKTMHRAVTGVVGFANILDVYEFLGEKEITVQTAFGLTYIKDFLGLDTLFLLSDSEIKRGRVIATPVNNVVLYYVDPSDSDFAKAGLQYTVSGETNLIGYHSQGNYSTAVTESFALLGLTLFAEYLDGIAVIDVKADAASDGTE